MASYPWIAGLFFRSGASVECYLPQGTLITTLKEAYILSWQAGGEMGATVREGTLVLRVWDKGLNEFQQSFATIDELFDLCLRVGDPTVVDRIVLRGTDEQGETRTLVFTFQSISRVDAAPPATSP